MDMAWSMYSEANINKGTGSEAATPFQPSAPPPGKKIIDRKHRAKVTLPQQKESIIIAG